MSLSERYRLPLCEILRHSTAKSRGVANLAFGFLRHPACKCSCYKVSDGSIGAFSTSTEKTVTYSKQGTDQISSYLLTSYSTVLLEKLTGSAASQEIPHIFGTRKFLTVPTSARHLSLSSALYIYIYIYTYLLTYLLHGAQSFLIS